MLVQWLFANLLICYEATPQRAHRDVVTSQGVVRGYLFPRPPHFVYLGLPYGRPPTRPNRFKAPKPVIPWDGIFEATHRVICPQPDEDGDENCLVLNVFTPQNATSLPVLVHVHGGGFQRGWGSFNPPVRLLRQGFVIVTFNYRLGALGFLCLGNSHALGNAGIKDQVALLYWVQRNISKFGGNPLDITLYGSEFGAAAVEFLLLSGITQGLFHKVIMESGSALSPLSMVYNPVSIAFEVAIKMGYNGTKNIDKLTTFYRKIPVKTLVSVHGLFLPCIENEQHFSTIYLKDDPLATLIKGNFLHLPILITYKDKETLPREIIDKFKTVQENFDYIMPNNLEIDNDLRKDAIAEIIKEIYFLKDIYGTVSSEKYMEYIHDIYTVYPVVKTATLHAFSGFFPVYLMEFSYLDNNKHFENAKDISYYFFGKYLNTEDDEVAEKLATLWSNFIKIGDPTPLTTYSLPVIWQPVIQSAQTSIHSVQCFRFGNTMRMTEPTSISRLAVWDYFYKKYYKYH